MAITDNLVAYWKLDETSGNASDSVGSSTLTNNNSVVYASGKINNGADLERSSSQSLSCVDNASLSLTGDFTFSLWLKLESHPADGEYYGIINKWQNAGQRSYEFFYYQESGVAKWGFDTSSDGTNNTGFIVSSTLSTGVWYYVTFVKSSTTGTIYVNGSSIGTGTVASTIKDGTDDFRIGRLASVDYFDGMIDEVGVWSRALSGSEITRIYNGGNGVQYPFLYTLIAGIGSFILTGNSANIGRVYTMLANTGSFILTGIDVLFRFTGWSYRSKSSSTWNSNNKSSTTWTFRNK